MRKDHFLVLVLLLSPSLAFGEDGKPKKWWSTPLIIVLYIGFFLVAAGVAICVRHFRDRNLPLHYQHEREVRGLDAEEIESLPSLRFSEAKMHRLKEEDQQVECAVCLSEFKDQEVLRILPDCFHVFHPSCIAPWLSSHVTCPICRSSLEHRQGSSVSMSSAFDATSGPLSQRFGHSGYFQHIMDDNDEDLDHDHEHVTVNIEGSSNVHSEVLSDDGPSTPSDTGKKLHRSYSTGDMIGKNKTSMTTSWSPLFPKESSPKSDYHITVNNNAQQHWSSIMSFKSDRFVDYSSLILVQMKGAIRSPSHVTSTLEP
ncbi:E3 ubiquitin-protein ligase ATL9-like [Chenopodium quinoa]|uniref:E3 ubiquitin-protein ligase ATL9-like n=1 Tax=Chenopodium quinoa TaxID=63459 RepID=UPI000B786B5B|nr:E3 ubiquitin-protein ligase ATL9-like [Chenopodium quinoa]